MFENNIFQNTDTYPRDNLLTQWGRETHICVSKLTIIGSDIGLSPGRRQSIIWINAETLLIGTLGACFNKILMDIYTFSFTKMHLKLSSAKWRPFWLGLHVLTTKTTTLVPTINRAGHIGGHYWYYHPASSLKSSHSVSYEDDQSLADQIICSDSTLMIEGTRIYTPINDRQGDFRRDTQLFSFHVRSKMDLILRSPAR